jgi:hypothetical protein
MISLAALGLGAAAGTAVVGAGLTLAPAPPDLGESLARLRRVPGPPAPEPEPGFTGPWANRLGRLLKAMAESTGRDFGRLGPDLRLVGRPLENHLGAKGLLAIVGLLLPNLWGLLMGLAGAAHVGLPATLGVGLVLAGVGFVLPDVLLRAEATERREAFSSAFGTFLDMVTIGLAGGGVGVEGALMDAARIGRGREAAVMRAVLEEAMWSGESQWSALRRLGLDLGLPELVEVASTVSLAGTEGARVRLSMEAKARALRQRELAHAKGSAQAATERMAIPTALLMFGFILLVGYPAVDAVLSKI